MAHIASVSARENKGTSGHRCVASAKAAKTAWTPRIAGKAASYHATVRAAGLKML
eukprot:CAMPEP_0170172466 /NCGR_PEP_ID=MMETSP0040_2-20121228/5695_1 /TAXON_ID=641309 /ORGANISM="Lotharella oceanica, Strain CCMP622" /LENGTH=54 /DNA_ID=CAMNT_0010413125 /DNA_START=351 /DNA_END=515 /DNA_ORIENTATION=-